MSAPDMIDDILNAVAIHCDSIGIKVSPSQWRQAYAGCSEVYHEHFYLVECPVVSTAIKVVPRVLR